MDAEPARLINEALKEEKIDLFVTLPEEPTASLRAASWGLAELLTYFMPVANHQNCL